MKPLLRNTFLAAATSAILFACSGEPETVIPPKEQVFKGFHYSLDSILQKKEGIVHGVELSDPLNDVKSKEKKKPDELDVDYCLLQDAFEGRTTHLV